MEFVPVVEVIEVYGVFEGASVVGQAVGAQDGLAGAIIVVVTADGGVEAIDRGFVEFRGVLFDPGFKLRIGGFVLLDVVDGRIALEANAVEHHLVVAFAAAWITGGELAGTFE